MTDRHFPSIYKFILFFILLLWYNPSQAQNKVDSLFLNYLIDKNLDAESITFINSLQLADSSNFALKNDLIFKKAKAYYNIKSLDSAAYFFQKVPISSPNKLNSTFFAGLCHSYLSNLDLAKVNFLAIENPDSLISATKNFELASNALLKRDFTSFDSHSKLFNNRFYQISKQEENLVNYKKSIVAWKKKSPFKAAMLSAIVPGLGKLYVGGQLGQGISTFLQNAVMGIQAIEAYKKSGPKSARFIAYTSLFGVFYLGNIWGTALSVSVKKQEFNDKINDQILFDMHIPLRALFN
jgi:hypothetical protein